MSITSFVHSTGFGIIRALTFQPAQTVIAFTSAKSAERSTFQQFECASLSYHPTKTLKFLFGGIPSQLGTPVLYRRVYRSDRLLNVCCQVTQHGFVTTTSRPDAARHRKVCPARTYLCKHFPLLQVWSSSIVLLMFISIDIWNAFIASCKVKMHNSLVSFVSCYWLQVTCMVFSHIDKLLKPQLAKM